MRSEYQLIHHARAVGKRHAVLQQKRADRMRLLPQWRWHLDEVFAKINSVTHYLWRAADHGGEVLEAYVSKKRDRKAALKFLKKP